MRETQGPHYAAAEELASEAPRRPRLAAWGLRSRLLGVILVVALTTLGVGAFGIQRMPVLRDDARDVYEKGAVPLDGLRDLARMSGELQDAVRRFTV